MFIDARRLSDGTEIEADVLVAGAGAAGITLARRLQASGLRVVVLESGGHEFEAETQELAGGEVSGAQYWALDTSRLRYFGGTTNHWTGWCRPLDKHDFEVRPWVKDSGWPLSREELEVYYRGAHELTELGEFDYSPDHWAKLTGNELLPFEGPEVETTIWQLSTPTRFGPKYRKGLEKSQSVQVLLYANLVELETDESGKRVTSVLARCLQGNQVRVKAEAHVLALGGLDNARMLLLAGGRPGGLGNEHGLVGRYFSDHPHVLAGTLLCGASESALRLYEDVFDVGRPAAIQATVSVSPAALEELRLLGFTAVLRAPGAEPSFPEAHAAAVSALWSGQGEAPRRFELHVRAEQIPDPESRVTLSRSKDALGLPKVNLRWRHDKQTLASIKRGIELVAQAFGRAGLGRVHSYAHSGTRPVGAWPEIAPGNHHIGTTRMAEDPRQGVVDRDLLVHGTENLFVLGSSVFPTSGYANPTLTICALALRLAEHLPKAVG